MKIFSRPPGPDVTQANSAFATYWLYDNSRFKGREGTLVLSTKDDTVRFVQEGNEVVLLPVTSIQKVIITGAMVTILSAGNKYRFIHRKKSPSRSVFGLTTVLIVLPQLLPLSLMNIVAYMQSVVAEWVSYFETRQVTIVGSYETAELSTVNLIPGGIYVILGSLFSWDILNNHSYGTDNFNELFGSIWLVGSSSAIIIGIYALLYNRKLGKTNISKIAVPWAWLMGCPILLCGFLYCVLGIHLVQNQELLPNNPAAGQMVIFFGILNFIVAIGLFFVRDKGIDTFNYSAAELNS